jgi:hypothetical protein
LNDFILIPPKIHFARPRHYPPTVKVETGGVIIREPGLLKTNDKISQTMERFPVSAGQTVGGRLRYNAFWKGVGPAIGCEGRSQGFPGPAWKNGRRHRPLNDSVFAPGFPVGSAFDLTSAPRRPQISNELVGVHP